jgi:hypothetical protein
MEYPPQATQDNTDIQEMEAALPEEGIAALGEAEITRIKQGLSMFALGTRRPVEEKVSFFGEFGIESGFLSASAIGATVISALRVGTILLVTRAKMLSAVQRHRISFPSWPRSWAQHPP